MPVDKVATPKPNPSTGKSIGVIGGGPAGLTAAYFLALMGHKIEVYETHDKLGRNAPLWYSKLPFPKRSSRWSISAILNSGDIHVTYNTTIGKDIPVKDIYEKHDAIFVGIGAQTGKTLRIEGADAGNVVSAVDILDQIGKEIFLITLAKMLSLSVVVTLLWTVQEVLSDATQKKYHHLPSPSERHDCPGIRDWIRSYGRNRTCNTAGSGRDYKRWKW